MSVTNTSHNIADVLTAAFTMYGSQVGYEDHNRKYLISDHSAIIRRMAAALHQQYDIAPGDRIGILAQTCHSYVALWHGAMLGYYTAVPLNHRLAAPELASILGTAKPKLLIYDRHHADMAEKLAQSGIATAPMEELAASSLDPLPARQDVDENEIAIIMFTGGTTGLPKGVMMTQKGFATASSRLHFSLDLYTPGTCFYTTTNLFHISGIYSILGPILMGNRTFITASFDVPQLVKDVAEYKVTHMTLVGVMIDMFLDAIEGDPSFHRHVRLITYGGAPVTSGTVKRLKRILPNTSLTQSYAMTETMSNVTILTSRDHDAGGQRLLSVGRPAPGMQFELRKPDGQIAELGQAGEIYLRTNCIFAGYWENDEANEQALSDGWYRTGDVGYMDEDNYLYLVDRAKDMIITGGENVYSLEVERAIEKIADVTHVAVIGLPSKEWGEQVHAVLVPKPGADIDTEQMLRDLRGELAGYKCPKSVEIRSELPLTSNNKINKVALRREYDDEA